ncbi:hypothetical protein [uncultured Ruegeria sp.]|uniref:hypothetical protein n=1 Tax=uncultured Ruegeria sp. TaxID=259304 RepID=UPI002613DF94|nr:hypothetical protein [uncultured Ruegeria sp.]
MAPVNASPRYPLQKAQSHDCKIDVTCKEGHSNLEIGPALCRFHRDPQGRKCDGAKIWPPKIANATIHEDPGEQEAFVVLKSEESSSFGDAQVKFRSDRVILRRNIEVAWQGVQADAMGVIVRVADGVRIKLWHDGSVTRRTDMDRTTIELDSSVFRRTKYTSAYISGDGSEVETLTPAHDASITDAGVQSLLDDDWQPG